MIRPLLRNLRQSLLRWGVGVELRPFPQAHPIDLLGLLVQQRAATADAASKTSSSRSASPP